MHLEALIFLNFFSETDSLRVNLSTINTREDETTALLGRFLVTNYILSIINFNSIAYTVFIFAAYNNKRTRMSGK